MAEYLDITGRIRTTASDQNVVDAFEVYDEDYQKTGETTRGKKQRYINSDFESRIYALHAQDYSYYYATSDDASIATILPSPGTAGKIYRIANWNANATGVDPTYYDTAYYSEYAWDVNAAPPAYTLLSVSASGITDTPAENDPRLITSRGVKSAIDNVAFSTSEKVNEVGIDSTPTPASENLIKSKGVADLGYLIDNPEWIRVITDSQDHVLAGIKSDGTVEWLLGVPTPVKEYIDTNISVIWDGNSGTALDGLTKIIAFLDDFTTANTLKSMLDLKVSQNIHGDVIIGRNLSVTGTSTINGNTSMNGNLGVTGDTTLGNVTTTEDAIVGGDLSVSGDTSVGYITVNGDIETSSSVQHSVATTEYIKVETDSEGKLIAGRTPDGAAFENIGFSSPRLSVDGIVVENISDKEDRKELLLDAENRIISYRKNDGTKVEDSIEVRRLKVEELDLGENAKSSIKELTKILPPYYFENDYINKRVLNIQTAIMQMGRGDVFGFLTDTHPMNKDNVYSGRILQYIASQTTMQKVLFGGDIGPSDATSYGADTKALEGLTRSIMQQTERIYNPCREAGCEIYIARGNHDFASTDNVGASATGPGYLVNRKATRQTLFAYCDTNKVVTNEDDDNAMYYYFDNELQKIRYIVVDTSDNQTDNFDPQAVQSNVATQIGDTQIQWIVESAILTTPSDYEIVFMGHIVPARVAYGAPSSYVWNNTADKKSMRNLVSIIDAVQTNTNVTIDLMGGGTYTCNFENFTPKVLLCVAGHMHFDSQSYSNGCMYYISGADLFTQESSDYPRVEKQLFNINLAARAYGTITENLVNIIIVDVTNEKIKLFRVGSGVDKIFNTSSKQLSVGSTLTLTSELGGTVKWKSYDATIFGPSNDNMFSHTITSVNESAGVVTGLASGESVVVAYSEEDNCIEFFDIKVN